MSGLGDWQVVPEIRTRALMTTSEVAECLGVDASTVRRWAEKGLLKVYRVGPRRDRRFELKEVGRVVSELRSNNGNQKKVRPAIP